MSPFGHVLALFAFLLARGLDSASADAATIAKSLSELNPDELAALTTWTHRIDYESAREHECNVKYDDNHLDDRDRDDRDRRSQSASDILPRQCNHCPVDGLCDNPQIRDFYQNKSSPIRIEVTWHVLPDGLGRAIVNASHVMDAARRIERSYAAMGLEIDSKFVVEPYQRNLSWLASARVAAGQNSASRHPYCESPVASHSIFLHLSGFLIAPDSYTILVHETPLADGKTSNVVYGTQMRAGDTILYFAFARTGIIEVVLYRFVDEKSFVSEKNPSNAVDRVVLEQGVVPIVYDITRDGDYFVWIYNLESAASAQAEYFFSFNKENCFSLDEFTEKFRPHLQSNSVNVIVVEPEVFQRTYFYLSPSLVHSTIDGYAFFPFDDTAESWRVGLAIVTYPALINSNWTVLEHEIGHVFGLWHPSHGVTETLVCKTFPDNTLCNPDQFECLNPNDPQCIPVAAYCDGLPSCFDNSDEAAQCEPLCYRACENPCRESDTFSAYIRDRVGDFCEDTSAQYVSSSDLSGSPCIATQATRLNQSPNLMASTNRQAMTHLTRDQVSRARCWLLNNQHQQFVSCRKWISVNYTDYVDDCAAEFDVIVSTNASIAVECDADPCLYVNPCRNRGRCVGRYDTVTCDCSGTGFVGPFCESAFIEIISSETPTMTLAPTSVVSSSCLETEHGCCPDGVTPAGPYHLDCPGVDPVVAWSTAFAQYSAEMKKWMNEECTNDDKASPSPPPRT